MKFIKEYIVQPEDIDTLNHVNNIIYLQWVQDVSAAHWFHITENALTLREQFAWVVIRHEIDYMKPALLGDHLTIETYVDNIQMVKSDRCVLIKRGSEVLAKAKTTWVFLMSHNLKPARISNEVRVVMEQALL